MRAVMFLYNSVCFFNHILDPNLKLDFNLIGGFLSAINTFATAMDSDGINNITIGPNKIIYSKIDIRDSNEVTSTITIIVFVESGKNEKIDKKILAQIKQSFLKFYTPEDIIQWDGNIFTFLPFKKIVNKIASADNLNEKMEFEREIIELREISIKNDEIVIGLLDNDINPIRLVNNEEYVKMTNEILEKIKEDLLYTFKNSNTNITWRAFMPLLNYNRIAYIFAQDSNFKADSVTESSILVAIYYIPIKFQLILPSLIPEFISKLLEINTNANIEDQSNLDSYCKYLMNSLRNLELINSTLNSLKKLPQNISVLLEKIKNSDQILYAILLNNPIIVHGPNDKVQEFLTQIQILSPHRLLRIKEYPEIIVEKHTTDIVAIDKNQIKLYKDWVQVNLDKMSVKNGYSCKFCEEIMNTVKELKDPALISKYISNKINWLISKAQLVLDLSWDSKIDNKEITSIRADMDSDTENIMLNFVGSSGTKLQNLVDKLIEYIPQNKIIIDGNFIKFGDKKVLVSFKLSNLEIEEYFNKLIKAGELFLGKRFIEESILKKI